MAVKASAQITLTGVVDVVATYRYYLLQSSTLDAPAKPNTYPPGEVWSDSEPTYANGGTNSLYFVDCTVFSDDTFLYSLVSLSTAYEAAKDAYNKAQVVQEQLGTTIDELEVVSEKFGIFEETIEQTIKETSREVIAEYDYAARLDTLEEEAAGFSTYRLRAEGYIRQGFIDYDENGVPILGIAIGQNLKSTTVTIDGTDYEQFDRTQSCAFYTAEKVSFRINGHEVAYVSNQKLYIREAEITTGNVTLGGKWHISTAKGFTIKYIGGE